jgi:hypothetical protein
LSPWAKAKVVLASIGFGTGLAGMALETRPLVWVAAGLLAVAFVIRLIERRGAAADGDQPSLRGE